MATAVSKNVKDAVFEWEGKDRNGKTVRGETRAVGENQVLAALRRVVPNYWRGCLEIRVAPRSHAARVFGSETAQTSRVRVSCC